jgi:hypothetical protein
MLDSDANRELMDRIEEPQPSSDGQMATESTFVAPTFVSFKIGEPSFDEARAGTYSANSV